jgi:biotin-dependent carboxylase-like uncharacterized protein
MASGPLLRVLACGPAASLQDHGRFGLQRHGVSPAGAMDREALAVANLLAGNAPGTAAIETALAGLSVMVEGGPCLVAAAGAGAELAVAGRKLPAFTAGLAEPGETVTLGPARAGVYVYLAVGGGFRREPELGSLSVHRRSGIGGAPVAAGELMAVGASLGAPMRLSAPPPVSAGPIRVILGPQDDHAGADALAVLTGAAFTISQQADRMGVRLDGPAIIPAAGYNIVSDGIATGAIQLPGDGRPIVLLRDRQTTGGYPKIATVISADIGRFAQSPPGSTVRFAIVTREEAIAAARAAEARLRGLSAMLVAADAAPTTELLLSVNLIGGVTAG